MSLLSRLRGEPLHRLPLRGSTLTLYRGGSRAALLVALGGWAAFNLPWHWAPGGEQVARIAQPLVAAMASYLAATLIASRTSAQVGVRDAASRWL